MTCRRRKDPYVYSDHRLHIIPLAATDGVSLNQFIAAAVAEKVGSLRAADDFLRERAGTAKPRGMLKYLGRAPKVAPNPDDMP
jgi:hypothetical protein